MSPDVEPAELTLVRTLPLWWVILRDSLMLALGLTGIAYEHLRVDDPRPLLVITDLVLIGLIPLQHALPRVTLSTGPKD